MVSLLSIRGKTRTGTAVLAGLALVGLGACGAPPTAQPSPSALSSPTPIDFFIEARHKMVETGIVALGIDDPAIVAAMSAVPRHEFVPAEYLDQAYENHPLPIGLGQTISQPYIVALMTEQASIQPGDKVLEIGTGSGYQAAILSHMTGNVYSIEILEELAITAAERLKRLGYDNVHTRHADGYDGWPEKAPFEAIVVTAAPDHVPPPLVDQLAVGGVMVIPVGPVGGYQELWKIERLDAEQLQATSLGGVRFVPLVRGEELEG